MALARRGVTMTWDLAATTKARNTHKSSQKGRGKCLVVHHLSSISALVSRFPFISRKLYHTSPRIVAPRPLYVRATVPRSGQRKGGINRINPKGTTKNPTWLRRALALCRVALSPSQDSRVVDGSRVSVGDSCVVVRVSRALSARRGAAA
jgi:hypothetical protein